MSNALLTHSEVAAQIRAGKTLLLAGTEALLKQLPAGCWIGGTIPYFMTAQGGCLSEDRIFATELPFAISAEARVYEPAELKRVYQDGGADEVSFIILPADSAAHTEFALNAPRYAEFAAHSLLGWVSGVNLNQLGQATPQVFCGNNTSLANAAAVLRVKLPAGLFPQIGIINLFQPGTGSTITFPQGGLSATTALVDGRECNLADYLAQQNADTRLPLVANYNGAMINVSFRSVDTKTGRVEFYAPVVSDVEYKLAAPVADYVTAFEAQLRNLRPDAIAFSCNCILNYLHSQLECRRTGGIVGPITFGEIAYQLLNQTLVYLELHKA
jgi:hypothetical protein